MRVNPCVKFIDMNKFYVLLFGLTIFSVVYSLNSYTNVRHNNGQTSQETRVQILSAVHEHYNSYPNRELEQSLIDIELGILLRDTQQVRSGLETIQNFYLNDAFNSDMQSIFRLMVFSQRGYDQILFSEFVSEFEKELSALETNVLNHSNKLISYYIDNPDAITKYSNQEAWLGYLFLRIGEIHSDTTHQKIGTVLIDKIISQQHKEGWFPEGNEFDTQYQTVTLAALKAIYTYSNFYNLEKVYQSMILGIDWELEQVDGCVDDSQNSRTKHNPYKSTENKQINPYEIAHNLLTFSDMSTELDPYIIKGILENCID